VRKILGYLPQSFGVLPRVSAEEMLNHYAVLKGLANAVERKDVVKALLEQVNLYQVRKKRLAGFSGGMKQRFGIAQALLGDPKLIIVDEPTAGLDPAERVRFNNLLSEISESKIVILSTHIVEDVSDLCSDMAIIDKGEVLLQGNPGEILAGMEGHVWEKRISKEELADYQQKYQVIYSRLNEGKPLIHILSENDPEDGFVSVRPNLEDVYFSNIQVA
ncbi:MAG: ATP-binding cassette domain-containing protein, partial [Bacteroidetes bacterium]|nr:ATP-binding cassette domain-containing protein [Bacteroidota bacterium]